MNRPNLCPTATPQLAVGTTSSSFLKPVFGRITRHGLTHWLDSDSDQTLIQNIDTDY